MSWLDQMHHPEKYWKIFFKWGILGALMGIIGGLLGAVFHHALHFVTHLRGEHPWLIYLLPLAGLASLGIYHVFRLRGNRGTNEIIDAILNGDIKNAPTKTIQYFDFEVPTELPGVDPAILDPRDTYADASEWEVKAKDLAGRFVKNFQKFTGNEEGKSLVAAGPKVE